MLQIIIDLLFQNGSTAQWLHRTLAVQMQTNAIISVPYQDYENAISFVQNARCKNEKGFPNAKEM